MPPLPPEAGRGKRRDGQQTDTKDPNGASRAKVILNYTS
jgi:hypothetical protein